MEKKIIKIHDKSFIDYVPSCTLNNESLNITWDKNKIVNDGDIVFFTDGCLHEVNNYTNSNIKKCAWLLEPPIINNYIYQYMLQNWDKFDMIFTFDENLLKISDKFKLTPSWNTWIKPDNQKISKKNKLISIIVSDKKDTFGHKLRHQCVDFLKENNIQVDIMGNGYNKIEDKSIGISDYCFSIVVENSKTDFYFTEKLVDCIISGTIPIYWGAKKIDNFFDKNGILTFDNIEELKKIIKDLSFEKYESLNQEMIKNFDIVSQFKTTEDFIYKNYLQNDWV
jgi:hypothetical protein